jgi:hypothetical protein
MAAFELPQPSPSDELHAAIGLWQRLELAGCGASHYSTACTADCVAEPAWVPRGGGGPEGDAAHVGLQLAGALERSHQRGAATAALERACARCPADARPRLALAKLLFKSGAKAEALEALQPLLAASRAGSSSGGDGGAAAAAPLQRFTDALAGDAFYLAGWACIHADDHTAAYALWAEGAALLPQDARLARQRRKLGAWAALCSAPAAGAPAPRHVGAGALAHAPSLRVRAHALPPGDPAHALFAPSQGGLLAFTSGVPLLTRGECAGVCAALDAHIAAPPHCGAWPSVRASSVRTTDIAVEEVGGEAVAWLRELLRSRLLPLLAACFPALADGSALTPQRLRLHDAFFVRYDAALGSTSLPLHSDTSALSVTLPLTQVGEDFEGGGLLLEALRSSGDGGCAGGVLNAGAGEAMLFAGPLRHGGAEVLRGVRTVLVLFLYVQDFAYGALLGHRGGGKGGGAGQGGEAGGSSGGAGAGAAQRGFVVYRETLALAEALRVGEEEEEA